MSYIYIYILIKNVNFIDEVSNIMCITYLCKLKLVQGKTVHTVLNEELQAGMTFCEMIVVSRLGTF